MLCFLNNQFTIILHFNQHHPQIMQISAAPDPVPSPTYSTNTTTSDDASTATQTESKINFSPPLIAMVIVIVTAFLIITYSRLFSKHVATPILNCIRQWRRRRRRRTSHVASSSAGDLESFHHLSNPSFLDSADHYQTFSPYGLDDSIIKTIPLSIYNSHQHSFKRQSNFKVDLLSKDCAVCLLEFEENDYLRTLPICSHAFHVDCIDIWLRSHANCPLCRARIILRSESRSSPFVPLMAGRIRPSLDGILDSILLEPLDEIQSGSHSQTQTPEQSILGTALEQEDQTFDFVDRRNLLKRSHSFGFERSFQPSMTSPWRRSTTASFWNKRRLSVSSPFSALTKSRVFSFRSTRLSKSPFFARRGRGGLGLFPFSETPSLASLSRRRSKSTVSTPAAGFSSSRLRCGDPEALLSPERFNRR